MVMNTALIGTIVEHSAHPDMIRKMDFEISPATESVMKLLNRNSRNLVITVEYRCKV